MTWVRTGKDEAERNRIMFEIKAPPPWEKKPRAADQKANADQALAAMANLQSIQGLSS